jgi:hypothetical protein
MKMKHAVLTVMVAMLTAGVAVTGTLDCDFFEGRELVADSLVIPG